jgi:5-methylcytosine-specific restriction protein A
MARTHGHGNPHWSRDETILALDLYFDCDGKVPSGRDERVLNLSQLLRRLPYHAEASKRESFRNGDGVAFKLQNLRQIATGRGLGNVSETDRSVWSELGNSPQRVRQIAESIRRHIGSSQDIWWDEGYEEEFFEGRLVTGLHLRRERSSKLRAKLIQDRRAKNGLACDMCETTGSPGRRDLDDVIFEAHHIVPLSATSGRQTRLADLALLCANCHRVIHRLIASEKRWVTPMEAQALWATSPHSLP